MTPCGVTVKQGQLVVGIARIYHASRVSCQHVKKAPDHKFNRVAAYSYETMEIQSNNTNNSKFIKSRSFIKKVKTSGGFLMLTDWL